MNTIVNERKLGFFEILGEGLKIFLFRFVDISLIALGSFVPTSLLLVFLSERLSSQETAIDAVSLFASLLLLFSQVVISIVASMSIAIITEKVVNNRHISMVEAIKYAASKWGGAVTTSLFASVIIFGLTLLLIIPGIIYWTYYVFVLYAVALRDKYGNEALKYSKILVEGQWWRVFGILLGIGVIFAIVNQAITIPLSNVSDSPYFAIVPSVISVYLSSIFGVMNVVLFLNNDFVYHHRLAKRKELAKLRKIKKAPSIEQYLAKTAKGKSVTSKPSSNKGIVRKTEKTVTRKASVTKRSAQNK